MPQNLRNRERKLKLLLDLSLRFQAERDVDRLIATVWENLTQVLEAERSSLFLLDEDTGELYSVVAQEEGEIRFPSDRGIAGAVLAAGRGELVADAYADPRFNPEVDRKTGFRTRSILAAPLLTSNGRPFGVAQVLNRRDGRPFDREDLELLESLCRLAGVAIETQILAREQAQAAQAVVAALVMALEMRLPAMQGHSMEVSRVARDLAYLMGSDEDTVEQAGLAGALHDIGKLGIPDELVNRGAPLSETDWPLYMEHVNLTHQLVEQMALSDPPERLALAASLHHKHYDGSGWPPGPPARRGIPLAARIVAVANALSSWSRPRWGCPALTLEEAFTRLQQESGQAYDPEIVSAAQALRERLPSLCPGYAATDRDAAAAAPIPAKRE